MIALLAALVFVAASVAAVAAIWVTWVSYRDLVFDNLAALGGVSAQREYRVATLSFGGRPLPAIARRQALRPAGRLALRSPLQWRAAA